MWCHLTGWLVTYTLRTTVSLKCQDLRTNCTATLLYEPQILQHEFMFIVLQKTNVHISHLTPSHMQCRAPRNQLYLFTIYCVILNSSDSKPVNWNYSILVRDAIHRMTDSSSLVRDAIHRMTDSSSRTGITGGSSSIFSHTTMSFHFSFHVN